MLPAPEPVPAAASDPGRDPRDRRLRPPTPRVALLLVAALVAGGLLSLAGSAVTPFVVGLLLFYLLNPAVAWLNRRSLPRGLAILVVYALVGLVVYTLLRLTLTPLLAQLQAFVQHLPDVLSALRSSVLDLYQSLRLTAETRSSIDSVLGDIDRVATGLNPGTVVPVVTSLAGFVASMLAFAILPAWLFYLLKDEPRLRVAFDEALPAAWRPDTWALVRIVDRVIGQWIRGQVLLGLTVGLASYVGLLILSATVDPIFGDFAVLLAVVSGLLELVPIIGPIIATVPAIVVGLGSGPQGVAAVVLLYFLIQQVENNYLVPKIQSDAVRLHPSVVMFSLVIGGAIGGLLGAIVSLPVVATGRDVVRYLFHRLDDPPVPVEDALARVLGERRSAAGDAAEQPSGRATIPPADPASAASTSASTTPARDPAGGARGEDGAEARSGIIDPSPTPGRPAPSRAGR